MSSVASYGKSGPGNSGIEKNSKSSGGNSSGSKKAQCDTTPAGKLSYYSWHMTEDSHYLIAPVTGGPGSATVIQQNDGFGGRNIRCGSFHVHTVGNSMKVSVVRFKGPAPQLDQNVMTILNGWGQCASNLGNLANACTSSGHTQHAALFAALKDAIAGSPAQIN